MSDDQIRAPSEGSKRCMIYSGPGQEVQENPVIVVTEED